ncbi:MAG: ankyrin repeat domain-containing protein, partial [Candidatus Jidaibacter sp.]|nr:ankyrin repeat domain-containing protein [Candidatus Jidaibacter sp.]
MKDQTQNQNELNNQLYKYIANGQIDDVKMSLAKGADVNAVNHSGQSPLHLAAENGNEKVVELLIGKGANVNAVDKDGWSPLHLAAENAHEKVVKLLCAHGANPCLANTFGATPLNPATENQALQSYLKEYQTNWNKLFDGAKSGNKQDVQEALNAGVNVNAVNNDGHSALHWAADSGNMAIVKLLIKEAAAVNAVDKAVNAVDKYGDTPLHWAIRANHTAVVELLIETGAKVNAVDKYGSSPLHLAALNGNEKVVELLCTHGANPFLQNSKSKTALDLAQKHTAVQKHLEKYQTNWNKLFDGAKSGNQQAVQEALNAGVNVNAVDNDGCSPLYWAAIDGNMQIVKLLCAHGANPLLENSDGDTALDLATENHALQSYLEE